MAAGEGERESARLLGSGRRRWFWLISGVALMVAGAVAVAVALSGLQQHRGVMVATRALAVGQVVGEGDVRVVEIAGAEDASMVPRARMGEVVGLTVLAPVAEGALLSGAQLGAASKHPRAGEAVVGAELAPSRFPLSLRSGARVSVVLTEQSTQVARATQAASREEPPVSSAGGSPEVVEARVQSISPPEEDGQARRVELVVDASQAAKVAQAAAAGRISVVEVAVRGGGR